MLPGVRDYGGLLRDPLALNVPAVAADALPALQVLHTEPGYAARSAGEREPLRELSAADRVDVLPAYERAGWEIASPRLYARADVVDRLSAAAQSLPLGFGLAVLDAWRPLELQRQLYEDVYGPGSRLPPGFVSAPSSDPDAPPPHLTGGALDLTLSWNGEPLALGSGFDEFGDQAHTDAFERMPGTVRELRRLLYWTMRTHGFVVLAYEWWHFEYGTRLWAGLCGEAPRYRATAP